MKMNHTILASFTASILLMACQKEKTGNDSGITGNEKTDLSAISGDDGTSGKNNNRGFVYTLSNQASGNKVMAFKRAADGTLSFNASYTTGGNGSGGGLGNQGAVILSKDGSVLLAVNAGSNSISSFKITGGGLHLRSTVNSGGILPVSIAQHDDLVYVLNAGGTGNISGFRLGENDKLTPIQHSSRPLSSASAGAAQVSFVRNGKVLVITEKATNKIVTYQVNEWGLPGAMNSITAASPTPFGFAAGRFGNIYVSEAVGGAPNASNVSSYEVAENGTVSLNQGPVPTGQSAACWVVLTGNGKHLYTTNTASNTLSSYQVQPFSGNISISQSIAAASGMGPIDAALGGNSSFLYVLNAGSRTITAFAVGANGSLSALGGVTGLPAGANGLAAD